MINERDRHIWQQMLAAVELFCSAPHHPAPLCDFARGKMTGEMLAFGIAVGVASLVCYLLMTRLQNRRANRRSPCDGPSPEAGNFTGAGASPVGSAAIILRSTAQAIPAVQAEAIAAAAAMGEAAAEAEAINNSPALTTRSVLIPQEKVFRFIPVCIRDQFGII
jgi:hypothetical protein